MALLKAVLKYKIPAVNLVWNLPIEEGDKIVHIGEQCGALTMWVERKARSYAANPGNDVGASTVASYRRFAVVGTGQGIPQEWIHCGTAICAGGALVWHLYEVGA